MGGYWVVVAVGTALWVMVPFTLGLLMGSLRDGLKAMANALLALAMCLTIFLAPLGLLLWLRSLAKLLGGQSEGARAS